MAHKQVPPVAATQTLETMFELQTELMTHYQKIESFPDWPWDMNIRENQKRLKGFGERFVDELSEAFEVLTGIYNAASNNQPLVARQMNKDFNAELGDAMCFIIEAMILAGVGPEELRNWITSFKGENQMYSSMLQEDNLLTSFTRFAFFRNQQEGYRLDGMDMFQVVPMLELLKYENHEWLGARRVSEAFCKNVAVFLWFIDHNLRQAFRKLKLKEWSQAQEVANVFGFQHSLIDTFILFIQLLQYIEKNDQSIYNTYYLTYLKNMERIKGGY